MRYPRYENLKRRLRNLGRTQEELAEAIGYSRPHVTAVLNGYYGQPCIDAVEAQICRWEAEAEQWRRSRRPAGKGVQS